MGGLIAALALTVSLSLSAVASASEPTGDFAVFKQCPRFTTGVNLCLYSETTSGEVTLHKQTVPITSKIVLQGGIISKPGETQKFVGALNGETLSKASQKVPGGLTDLVNCQEITGEGWAEKGLRFSCELVFENSITGVNAITELAKPASEIGINTEALEDEFGVALKLPVKVRLENSLLGSECYIGSSSSPIVLNLTDGETEPKAPNKPISGKVGEFHFKDKFEFVEITNNTLVDNSFSAPGASGCGGIFSFLLDPVVDSKLGLPAEDGYNTAIQNNRILEGGVPAIKESEK